MPLVIDKDTIPVANFVSSTYNRLEFTKQTLPNIYNTASDNIDYMITIIDNGSTDGSREYLLDLFENKKISTLVLLKENVGVAKSQNIGWKLFDDISYYAKIDNDVLFNKNNWLNDIVNVLLNAPEIGALGFNCEPDYTKYQTVNNGKVAYMVKGGNIGGACFFVPKHIHQKLGFWCEAYDKYGEEDADYGSRIMVSGFKNTYMLENIMVHIPDLAENNEYIKFNEYRVFKDEQRKDNLKGLWQTVSGEYWNKKRELYIDTNILNEIKDFEFYSHAKDDLI